MNPTLTQLAHELRDAILRWKAKGLIRLAPPAAKTLSAKKKRTLARWENIQRNGFSKHDSRRLAHLTPEQRREHRRTYRRDWARARKIKNCTTPTLQPATQ